MTDISTASSIKLRLLSFFGALLIVAIHTTWMPWNCPLWNRIANGFLAIPVPYYFIVSGYFLAVHVGESGWWPRAVVKRIASIGIPYVAWLLVALAVMALADVFNNLYLHRPWLTNLRGFGGSGTIYFGFNCWHYPGIVPFWFLRCLFLLVLISPLIVYFLRAVPCIWILCLLAADFCVTTNICVDPSSKLVFFLTNVLSIRGMLFFSLGLWLRLQPWQRLAKSRGGLLVAGIILGCGWLIPVAAFSTSIPFCLALLYLVWRIIPVWRLPSVLSASAFPIFIMHAIVFEWFWPLATFCGLKAHPLVYGVTMWTVGVAVPIMISFLMHRFSPRVTKVLLGGR